MTFFLCFRLYLFESLHNFSSKNLGIQFLSPRTACVVLPPPNTRQQPPVLCCCKELCMLYIISILLWFSVQFFFSFWSSRRLHKNLGIRFLSTITYVVLPHQTPAKNLFYCVAVRNFGMLYVVSFLVWFSIQFLFFFILLCFLSDVSDFVGLTFPKISRPRNRDFEFYRQPCMLSIAAKNCLCSVVVWNFNMSYIVSNRFWFSV